MASYCTLQPVLLSNVLSLQPIALPAFFTGLLAHTGLLSAWGNCTYGRDALQYFGAVVMCPTCKAGFMVPHAIVHCGIIASLSLQPCTLVRQSHAGAQQEGGLVTSIKNTLYLLCMLRSTPACISHPLLTEKLGCMRSLGFSHAKTV